MKIRIANRSIGGYEPCFIIAEAGVNHNGDINLAKRLIYDAVDTGVDAIKFQTFKAEKLVTATAKQADYQTRNIGKEESQYDMLKRLELGYEDFRQLKRYCDEKGIIFLSTPHSCEEDVDLVSELCPAIKVASPDLINLPFLKYISEKQLPIILSTGMGTMEEVREAVNAIKSVNKQLILLHCTTNYPTPLKDVNLKAMQTMKKEFNLPVGYSDHTMGIDVPVAAVALGANVIEKHYTLDKNMEGPDHKASLEPDELKEMVNKIRSIEQRLNQEDVEDIIKELNIREALGNGIKRPTGPEMDIAKIIRKGIHAAVDINKETVIEKHMIHIRRPQEGLHPREYWRVLGKTVKRDIKKDEPLTYNDLK